ncbi:hypothetical protein [Pseudomonas oryzihabitans]|uniref:hypothetical protein n=1 Tax=Pseudomonas oryzihabitans TaxID=47885 RepID=UPI00289430D2|nr:hypothetical protein [Pseudomonas oryzihabitans]MDT3721529.1 hypothetical protein [Pseudomonas oryzihabitans]
MSTESQTNTLPEDVAAALANHDQAKAAYLTQRETLVTLGKRLEKHRATGRAARHESETAGSEWRADFRDADGELTPEVLKAKRDELDKRELAESYEQLATELEPSYQLAQVETAYARRTYDSALERATAAYGDHCLAIASAALFATAEGRTWLRLIQRQEAQHLHAVIKEEIVGDGQTAKGQAERQEAARGRLERALAKLVDEAAAAVEPAEADPFEQTLQAVDATAYELTGRATSVLALNRQRAEAQVLLEQQGQQRSA